MNDNMFFQLKEKFNGMMSETWFVRCDTNEKIREVSGRIMG